MVCHNWTVLYVLLALAAVDVDIASGRAYSIEELNSVTLVLDVTLREYEDVPVIRDTLYNLIANLTSKNCTVIRQNCKLVAKYYRKVGPYKRNITSKDYTFTPELISELISAEEAGVMIRNGSEPATKIVFNLRTFTGYDYLKWTEIVRIVYYFKSLINNSFREESGLDVDIILENPTSYIAKVIDENITAPTAIACSILGAALLLFIVLVPLSNTKYCRKELKEDMERGTSLGGVASTSGGVASTSTEKHTNFGAQIV